MLNCDAEIGACSLPEPANKTSLHPEKTTSEATVRYIGDPMCSWCWGISPTLKALADYCQENHINFTVHVGGLRAGGGDAWNDAFKAFLRHEWETIHRVTGQPFGFTLLDEAEFNYDTEPACRAVVAMRHLLEKRQQPSQTLLAFFSGIQKQFYVNGTDPKQPAFYRDLCAQAGIPYEEFLDAFTSATIQLDTLKEFQRCRNWGVRAFPTLLLDVNQNIIPLASGHTSLPAVVAKIESVLQR